MEDIDNVEDMEDTGDMEDMGSIEDMKCTEDLKVGEDTNEVILIILCNFAMTLSTLHCNDIQLQLNENSVTLLRFTIVTFDCNCMTFYSRY